MLLTHISYAEFEGRDQEWVLDGLQLGVCNLLVGKNATGKTRSLNVIGTLARVLRGEQPPALASADYKVTFSDGPTTLEYSFHVEEGKVVEERFTRDSRELLTRGVGGVGTLFAEQIDGGKVVSFQTPQDELAVVVRRDALQHPYLQPLYDWADGVRHYHFGTTLGRDNYAMVVPQGGIVADDRDPMHVVGLFRKAYKHFDDAFKQALLRDMRAAGYPLEDIGTGPPVSVRFLGPLPGELVGLWVKEKGLKGVTDQSTMSQGMFRVLSILILANHIIMAKTAGCVLIDDIGEGLDFDRSCALIDLLRAKAASSRMQLVASTNDKFVMNRVPLEDWSLLQREGNRVRVRNQHNSRELFEDFRFTGLSNFSFLELDFAGHPPLEPAAAHE